MTSPFDSSRSKIARGKKHFKDLQDEIRAFEHNAVHAMTAERDPKVAGGLVHKIKLRPIPNVLADIASDAACNLRDALDHAVYASAVVSGKTNPRCTAFPFGRNLKNLETKGLGRCQDAPEDVRALLLSFKPYKGGNSILWALSQVSNTSKHIVLIPMGVTASQIAFKAVSVGRGHQVLDPPRWDAANNEIVLATSWEDSDFHCNVEVTFSIAFDEIDIVKGKPAVAVFSIFTDIVETIVAAIEAETRRLFPAAFQ